MTEEILQQVSTDSSARIDRREDKQRLEHDGEVIPEVEPAPADDAREDLRHADRQRRRSTCTAKERVLASGLSQLIHLLNRHGEAEPRHRRHGCGRALP
jgi:hypothetical protein